MRWNYEQKSQRHSAIRVTISPVPQSTNTPGAVARAKVCGTSMHATIRDGQIHSKEQSVHSSVGSMSSFMYHL
jgi:hypothetical protein